MVWATVCLAGIDRFKAVKLSTQNRKRQESGRCVPGQNKRVQSSSIYQRKQTPRVYPIRQEFMNPPARLDLGLMINVDADHSVKFDAQLVRARLVSSKFWGQNYRFKTRITVPTLVQLHYVTSAQLNEIKVPIFCSVLSVERPIRPRTYPRNKAQPD